MAWDLTGLQNLMIYNIKHTKMSLNSLILKKHGITPQVLHLSKLEYWIRVFLVHMQIWLETQTLH